MTALHSLDFRRLIGARFLYSLAYQMQAVVMGWQMYELTRDPLMLGLIGLAEAIPALSLALFAGDLVDRGNPLRIYKGVVGLAFLGAFALLASTSGLVPFAPRESTYLIFAAAFLSGVARGFSGPALYSLIPQLVPRDTLRRSSAWMTSVFQLASMSGPALGGVLYSWKGPLFPYAAVCLLLGAALTSLGFMAQPRARVVSGASESAVTRLTSGLRFVFGHQLLVSALALDMFAVLFGGATALLPIFSGEILMAGPTGLGILRASPAVGALAGSLLMIRFPAGRSAGSLLLASVAGFGVSIMVFGISKTLWLSCIALAMSGFLDSMSMVIRTAIVQLSSPDEMRGRIAAVNSIFIGSSNEIGAFESGVAARLLGTVPSVVFGGAMTLLTVAVTAWAAPKLREMDLTRVS